MLALCAPELNKFARTDTVRNRWEREFAENKADMALVLAQAVAEQALPVFINQMNNGYLSVPTKQTPLTCSYKISINKVVLAFEKVKMPAKKQSPFKEWSIEIDGEDSVDYNYFSKFLVALTREIARHVPSELKIVSEKNKIKNLEFATMITKIGKSCRFKAILWLTKFKKVQTVRQNQQLGWTNEFHGNMKLTARRISHSLITCIKGDLSRRMLNAYELDPFKPKSIYIDLGFQSALQCIANIIPEKHRLPPFAEWIQHANDDMDHIDSAYFTDKFLQLFRNVSERIADKSKELKDTGIIVSTKLNTSSDDLYLRVKFYASKDT